MSSLALKPRVTWPALSERGVFDWCRKMTSKGKVALQGSEGFRIHCRGMKLKTQKTNGIGIIRVLLALRKMSSVDSNMATSLEPASHDIGRRRISVMMVMPRPSIVQKYHRREL